MKEILIMRHGKSDWNADVENDFDRPLNKSGRKAARLMGKKITEYEIKPDVILSSSALRAERTAKIVAKYSLMSREPKYYDGFYYENEDFIIDEIKNLDNTVDRVLIVGHNPMLSNLIKKLTSGEMDTKIKFPTAGLAKISCNVDNWREINAEKNELKLLVYPKLFKKKIV